MTTSNLTGGAAIGPSAAKTQPAPQRSPSRLMRRVRLIAWNALPPLTFVAIVAIWSLSVRVFQIPAYLLPAPAPCSRASSRMRRCSGPTRW